MNSRLLRGGIAAALPALLLMGCASAPAALPVEEGRTVDTLLGQVTVPSTIESVVVIEGRRDLDIVLSLGLPLAGYPYEEEGALDLESPLADALDEAKAAGAKELFLADEINIESIAAAAPDLIISRVDDVEPILAELTAIAPVLPIGDQSTATWQDDLRLVAEATGTEARAEELIADYDERIAGVRAEYSGVLAEHTFAPMSYNGEGVETRPNRLLSTVLRDIEATPSAAFANVIDGGESEYSLEQLVQGFGDADGLVALVNDAETWKQLESDPLYQQLPAVQAGHVVRSDKQTHEGAAITAQHSLTVIEQLLATY